jgi:uncharacterized Zn finger protein (UPF0148 family)
VPGGALVPVDTYRGAGGRVVTGDGMEERQAWLKSCVERRGPGACCIERRRWEVELMAGFVDLRPVLVDFQCPRCKRKLEELAGARMTCPLCGVRMVKQKAGPSARVRSGQATAQAVAIGRETAVLSAKSRLEKAVFNEFHAEKRSL